VKRGEDPLSARTLELRLDDDGKARTVKAVALYGPGMSPEGFVEALV
jgi:hypothetical protein